MEFFGKISLYIHIIAGVSTLIAGPIALIYNKNNSKHKMAGQVFFYAMTVVIITSVLGFLQHTSQLFYQFLLGIAFMVGYNILRGIRAIRFMKGSKTPGVVDVKLGWSAQIIGLLMICGAGYYYTKGVNIAFPILFTVFGTMTFLDGRRFLKLLQVPALDKRWWLRLHLDSMFSAFIASTTAFSVNAVDFAPWYIQWFAPAILLVPLQIYLQRSRKVSNRDLENPLKKRITPATVA